MKGRLQRGDSLFVATPQTGDIDFYESYYEELPLHHSQQEGSSILCTMVGVDSSLLRVLPVAEVLHPKKGVNSA